MSLFAEQPFRFDAPNFLAGAIAGILLAVLVLFLARLIRPPAPAVPTPTPLPPPPPLAEPLALPEQADYWEPPPDVPDERRRSPRRSGNPTLVEVSGLGEDEKQPGHVVDRSRVGLRLAVAEPTGEGTILRVRAVNAPEGTPWARVVVRWVKEIEDRWELGCEFLDDLEWRVLLLFG